MSNPNRRRRARSESKFTRGEKCIFVHLIITFVLILLLIIVYFVHLCLVDHSLKSALKISRRVMTDEHHDQPRIPDYVPVGLVYLSSKPTIAICNAMLLRERWSLSPAHCVSIRSDPDMADLLRSWRIKYQTRSLEHIESEIKRSIPHPHFNRDDFSNNIGLFEHTKSLLNYTYTFPNGFMLNDDMLQSNTNNMIMFSWKLSTKHHKGKSGNIIKHTVRPVTLEKCARFMAPIVDLRKYEFCVLFAEATSTFPEHGAVFIVDGKVTGFFSWGEKQGKSVPFIIINIIHFEDWIQNLISL